MKIEDLLTTYWSQFTLLLAFIGYFIKRFLDYKSKKREINHNLFQQHRLKAVNDFFSSYAKTERMWKDIPIYKILDREINTKELDKLIFVPIDELRKNVMELQIYFSEKEHKLFKSILENILKIDGKLKSIYFNLKEENSQIVKSNEFGTVCENRLKKNNEILKEVSKAIKKTFR